MSGLPEHVWGVSAAQDRVFAQICGMAPSRAVGRLFVILQAYIDDSYTKDGVFVLGGYVASVESWAAFSKEWEKLLPYAKRARNGQFHFKMNEMAKHMDRVRAFYRIIEKHVLLSVFWKVGIAEAAGLFNAGV